MSFSNYNPLIKEIQVEAEVEEIQVEEADSCKSMATEITNLLQKVITQCYQAAFAEKENLELKSKLSKLTDPLNEIKQVAVNLKDEQTFPKNFIDIFEVISFFLKENRKILPTAYADELSNYLEKYRDLYDRCKKIESYKVLKSLTDEHIKFISKQIFKDLYQMSEDERLALRTWNFEPSTLDEMTPLDSLICRLDKIEAEEKKLTGPKKSQAEQIDSPALNLKILKKTSSKKMKLKIDHLTQLVEYERQLVGINTSKYPLEDIIEMNRFAFLSPLKEVKEYSEKFLKTLNDINPDLVSDLFYDDMDAYLKLRTKELEKEQDSIFFGIKSFYKREMGFAIHGHDKLSAAFRMEQLLVENKKPASERQEIKFTDIEIAALNDSRLGEIVNKYRQAGALPEAFLVQEDAWNMRVRQVVDRARP